MKAYILVLECQYFFEALARFSVLRSKHDWIQFVENIFCANC
jgi:hypothetical protein